MRHRGKLDILLCWLPSVSEPLRECLASKRPHLAIDGVAGLVPMAQMSSSCTPRVLTRLLQTFLTDSYSATDPREACFGAM
jgi:hypothetical protein